MAKYRVKPKEVEAIQLTDDIKLCGEFIAAKGDYLVIEDGKQTFVNKNKFEALYEEIKLELKVPQVPLQTLPFVNPYGSGPYIATSHHTDRLRDPKERAGLPGDYNPKEGLM